MPRRRFTNPSRKSSRKSSHNKRHKRKTRRPSLKHRTLGPLATNRRVSLSDLPDSYWIPRQGSTKACTSISILYLLHLLGQRGLPAWRDVHKRVLARDMRYKTVWSPAMCSKCFARISEFPQRSTASRPARSVRSSRASTRRGAPRCAPPRPLSPILTATTLWYSTNEMARCTLPIPLRGPAGAPEVHISQMCGRWSDANHRGPNITYYTFLFLIH